MSDLDETKSATLDHGIKYYGGISILELVGNKVGHLSILMHAAKVGLLCISKLSWKVLKNTKPVMINYTLFVMVLYMGKIPIIVMVFILLRQALENGEIVHRRW